MVLRSLRWWVAALTFGVSAAFPANLRAQTLLLRVVEEPGSTPAVGAIVRLIGGTGEVVRGMTDGGGRITLRANHPGQYTLRIARIGWTEAVTDSIELPDGQTVRLTIPVHSRRVVLATIDVRSNSPCRSDRELDRRTTELWEEIQKALTAHILSQASQLLHRREFIREVGLDQTTTREWVVVSSLMRGAPFASLPAASLATDGFVRLLSDSATFAAPDAALLLSNEFVSSHCFHAVPGPEGLVGLRFQPIPGRRITDVRGTLWVDRASSELRDLEFEYTGLPNGLQNAGLGGRVEFRRLPTGRWIVGYWHVRMPHMVASTLVVRGREHEVTRLAGYRDRGGRADVATDSTGRVDRAILNGTVSDSLSAGVLAGAIVTVVGTRDSVMTDASGRYSLAVRASGDRVVAVHHPKFTLVGAPTTRTVLLSLADTSTADFSTPSPETIARALCRKRGPAVLVGGVWRANGEAAAFHEVRATWTVPDRHLVARMQRILTTDRGAYALCELPQNRPVPVQAVFGSTILVEDTVRLEKGEVRWLDLREWGSIDTTMAALFRMEVLDSMTSTMESAVTLGTVLDLATGTGVRGATVVLKAQAVSSRTDSVGRFRIGSASSGVEVFNVQGPPGSLLRGQTSVSAILSPGDTTRVEFRVVDVQLAVRHACSAAQAQPAIVGVLTDALGQGLIDADVRLRWTSPTGSQDERRRTGPAGVFVFCSIPTGVQLLVHARTARGEEAETAITTGPDTIRWVQLVAIRPN